VGGPWRALGWKMGSRGGARRPSTALSPLPSFKPPNATAASLPAPGDKVAISRIHLLTDDVDFGDTNRSKSGPSPTSVRAGECKLGWPSDPDGRPAGAGCPGGGRAARRGAPSACAPPAPPGRPRSPSRGERRACGGRGTPGEGGAAVGSASPSVVCRSPPPEGRWGLRARVRPAMWGRWRVCTRWPAFPIYNISLSRDPSSRTDGQMAFHEKDRWKSVLSPRRPLGNFSLLLRPQP